jgi:type I restriction enzyme, R subunit
MAFLTEKVHRRLSGSFTFLIVTDRQELDKQIVKTFAGVGAIPNDSNKATDGEHLKELLKQNHRYIFTLIHKFNKPGHTYSDRPNIIVLCDEAHRTQYGNGLDHASFIAFTGTPLMEAHFTEWGLNIRPHRDKMNSRDLEEDFKNENHLFRLAIACAM